MQRIEQRHSAEPEAHATETPRMFYEPPRLVELGSVYKLTQAHCIDEHGSPLPFCASG